MPRSARAGPPPSPRWKCRACSSACGWSCSCRSAPRPPPPHSSRWSMRRCQPRMLRPRAVGQHQLRQRHLAAVSGFFPQPRAAPRRAEGGAHRREIGFQSYGKASQFRDCTSLRLRQPAIEAGEVAAVHETEEAMCQAARLSNGRLNAAQRFEKAWEWPFPGASSYAARARSIGCSTRRSGGYHRTKLRTSCPLRTAQRT